MQWISEIMCRSRVGGRSATHTDGVLVLCKYAVSRRRESPISPQRRPLARVSSLPVLRRLGEVTALGSRPRRVICACALGLWPPAARMVLSAMVVEDALLV